MSDDDPTVVIVGGHRGRGRPPRAEATSIVRTLRLSPLEQKRVDLALEVNRQKFADFARDALLTAAEDCLEPDS